MTHRCFEVKYETGVVDVLALSFLRVISHKKKVILS